MKKLFIVINNDKFFLSHRKQIAIGAKKAGYDVTVVAHDTGLSAAIKEIGVKFISMPINSTGMNLKEELQTFLFLMKLYLCEKPDIVHHVGIKVILWGTLAARCTLREKVINAVSGTGFLFSPDQRKSIVSILIRFMLVLINKKEYRYVFQNHDDEKDFIHSKIIKKDQSVFIKGSGVDLNTFKYIPEAKKNNDRIKIVFTGRMIEAKGVKILIEAANLLKQRYVNKIQFILCGDLDNNPTSIQKDVLEAYCDGEYINWLGFQNNIYDILKDCHIMAFPSFYMEGLPKSIIDAEAVGLPIITTDWVGCRDTVEDGLNGFIIPIKNSQVLAEKIEILVNDNLLRQRMGYEARLYAEKYFSIENVVAMHLAIYGED